MMQLNKENEVFFNDLREKCKQQGREMKEPSGNLFCLAIEGIDARKNETDEAFIDSFKGIHKYTDVYLTGMITDMTERCYYYTLSMLVEHTRRFGR